MSSLRNFHEGEAQLQRSIGIDPEEFDRQVDQPFQPQLNPSEHRFVGLRTFSIAASIDADRRPWASPLLGRAGELFVVEDDTTVRIAPERVPGDPLIQNIEATGEMGVLYFDPSLRRRAKSLGRGSIEPDGSITYRMHRMFGLCTKYIFKRAHDPASPTNGEGAPASIATELGDHDRAQLEEADTIFLASHSAHGTDPTHRGGPPGFVSVIDDTTISMPDYVGNGMFQTLGNLLLDDKIGFLALDFDTGRSLQITGHGSIHDADPADPLSQRSLVISIDEVRASQAAVGTWSTIAPYDFAP